MILWRNRGVADFELFHNWVHFFNRRKCTFLLNDNKGVEKRNGAKLYLFFLIAVIGGIIILIGSVVLIEKNK